MHFVGGGRFERLAPTVAATKCLGQHIMSLTFITVVVLSIATWVIPMTAAMGGKPKQLQFNSALILIVIALTSVLLAMGLEFAVGFLLLSLTVGGMLTWAVLFDSP